MWFVRREQLYMYLSVLGCLLANDNGDDVKGIVDKPGDDIIESFNLKE